MKGCHNCKNITICKIYEEFNNASTNGLQQHILSTSNNDKFESWMGIFNSIGKSCNLFQYNRWDLVVRIPESEDFISKMIDKIKQHDDYKEEISDITISAIKKKELISSFLDDESSAVDAFLLTIIDKIKEDDEDTIDNYSESICNLMYERMGL